MTSQVGSERGARGCFKQCAPHVAARPHTQDRTGIVALYKIGGFLFTDIMTDEAGERYLWVNAIDREVDSSISSLYRTLIFRGPYVLDMFRCRELVLKLDADRRWQEVTAADILERQAR